MIKDIVKYVLLNLWQRKTRTFLTMLSILIGIAAIFSLVSFGQGINKYVNDLAQKQGVDKILIMPKDYLSSIGKSKFGFTDDDLDFVRKIKGVNTLTGMQIGNVKIKFKDYKEKYVYAIGFSTKTEELELAEEFMAVGVSNGRMLKDGDVFNVLLGYNYQLPNKLFKKEIKIGDKVFINDIPFTVVGFLGQIGNPQDDSQIYVTFDGFKQIFGERDYEYMFMRADPTEKPAELAEIIKEKFRKHKNQKENQETFIVQTYEELIKTYTSIIDVINSVLVVIALISVIVAAVNIANTMYTSILERTQEIGIMKAAGAKNGFILLIFALEAGLLGLFGGAAGILVGYVIAKIGEFIAISYDLTMLKPAFSILLIISCLLFSFLVGLLSGILPARQASKLNAADALRYE